MNSSSAETARWKRCVPRARFSLFQGVATPYEGSLNSPLRIRLPTRSRTTFDDLSHDLMLVNFIRFIIRFPCRRQALLALSWKDASYFCFLRQASQRLIGENSTDVVAHLANNY